MGKKQKLRDEIGIAEIDGPRIRALCEARCLSPSVAQALIAAGATADAAEMALNEPMRSDEINSPLALLAKAVGRDRALAWLRNDARIDVGKAVAESKAPINLRPPPAFRAEKMEPPAPGEKCSLCGQIMPGGKEDQTASRALRLVRLCERAGVPQHAGALIRSKEKISALAKLDELALKSEIIRLAHEDRWEAAIDAAGIKRRA